MAATTGAGFCCATARGPASDAGANGPRQPAAPLSTAAVEDYEEDCYYSTPVLPAMREPTVLDSPLAPLSTPAAVEDYEEGCYSIPPMQIQCGHKGPYKCKDKSPACTAMAALGL